MTRRSTAFLTLLLALACERPAGPFQPPPGSYEASTTQVEHLSEPATIARIGPAFFGDHQPLLGRRFVAGDFGRGAAPVAIVSHPYWTEQLEERPDAIGRTIDVDGRARTLVGVMPAGLEVPEGVVLWVPGEDRPADVSGDPVPGSTPRIELTQDFRIDGYDAELLPISWLGASPGGTTVLVHAQNGTIRFFDDQGRELGTFGREGEGPGEFRRALRGGWKGDTLWISDTALRRVTLVSPGRELLRTLPPLVAARPSPSDSARLPTFPFAFPYALYADDEMFVSAIGAANDPKVEAIGGSLFLRVSADGVIQRVVLRRPANEGSVGMDLPGGGVASVSVPFFPGPHWTVSPDGARVATLVTDVEGDEGGTYTLRVYDAMGDAIFTRAVPFEGEPIDDARVDSVLEARAESARLPEMARAYRTDVPGRVPPVYPPVEDLRIDGDHRIWIELRATEEGSRWVLLDPEGRGLGWLLLPANTSLGTARGDAVWAVERDELDVESVVRFRMVGR